MANPLSFVLSILQLVLMINNTVGKFRHNKEDCHRITELLNRVRAVVDGLNIVEDTSVSDALSDVLNGLEKALKRAMKDIEAWQKKNVVVSIIQVSNIADMLRRIHDDISRNLSVADFAIGAYNISMLSGIKENVAALRADIASNRSISAIVTKEILTAPDGDLQRKVERLEQSIQNFDLGTYQNNKDTRERETNKTEFARLEVKVGENKVLADSNAPRASLSDGKAISTSVESVARQGVEKTSSSVSELVDKAHSVVDSPAPSQLQQVISVSEVPGEAGSYKVGSLSSETSKLIGAYAAGASFESNKETIRCPVTLTNKTDHYAGIWVKPINEQFTRTMIMEPHSSLVVSVTMKTHESLQDMVKFEALMIVVQSKHDLVELESSIGGKLNMDSGFMAQAKKLQAEVYRATLTAIICEPARFQQIILGSAENMALVTSIDVHPTKKWIVTTHKGGTVSIWDYQKQNPVFTLQVTKEPSNLACLIHKYSQYIKEKAAPHWLCSVKFISQEKWLAVGDGAGYIYVYAYADTELQKVKKFRAYHGKSVDSLAVHPSEPYLLSSSACDGRIKHWDWSRKWEKIQEFDVTTSGFLKDGVRSLKFNPRDTNTFACVTYANRAKVWNIKSSSLTATIEEPFNADYFFAPSLQHLMVTLSSPHECTCVKCTSPNSEIRDLETRKIVHTLGVNGRKTRRVACHPTLPIFATMLDDRTVCLWDASTYRLEKMVHIPDTDSSSLDMVFVTDTYDITRLIVTFKSMIAIMEVNMPMENTR